MDFSIKEKILRLRESVEELKAINRKQEELVNSNRERAESFAKVFLGLQIVFLVVIRIGFLSALKHKEWQVIFGTMLLYSVLFFAAFFEAVHKFYWTRYELDRNYIDLETLRHEIRGAENGNGHKSLHNRHEPDAVSLLERKLYIGFVSLVLILISATQLYACKLLLER